ncbi:hypothetical protein [Kamptonema formosum]|uniref:hypothetical protein n=1 Tax=Kamptonema formosum TaxID=331992 RepID=UPI00034A1756|nr:hypothetical protein [Oscillatoria sp. PCC 10802]
MDTEQNCQYTNPGSCGARAALPPAPRTKVYRTRTQQLPVNAPPAPHKVDMLRGNACADSSNPQI